MAYNLIDDYGDAKHTEFKITGFPVPLKKKIIKEVKAGEADTVSAFFRQLVKQYFKEKEKKDSK